MSSRVPTDPPWLLVLRGPNRGVALKLIPGRNRLGRSRALEVPLLDEQASREHAEITWEGKALRLRDLQSRNGTYLNGIRCDQAQLRAGDELRLGDVTLRVLLPWAGDSLPEDLATWTTAAGTAPADRAAAGPGFGRRAADSPPDLIGDSEAMRQVHEVVSRVAPREETVLIQGESGTGKELVARAVHRNSARRDGPFLALNAATLSGDLLASELFGHEPGSFTGATARRLGVFELSHGGTLFLDEVGELPLESQAQLLRLLEKQGFRRLGGETWLQPDVRLIAATHQNLERMRDEGTLRVDLFHRLTGFRIALPPLRERGEDIDALAAHFLARIRAESGRPPRTFSPAALDLLRSYPWPGNVRELRNVVERVSMTCDQAEVGPRDLPAEVTAPRPAEQGDGEAPFPELHEVERAHIQAAMALAEGNKSQAARLLGIDRVTLYARLRKHGLFE